jgi:hypothetical protein
MMSRTRDQRLYDEAADLWRAVSQSPPPHGCDAYELIEMAMRAAGVPAYDRLHSPHLRNVAGAGRPRA